MNITQKIYKLLCGAKLLHYVLPFVIIYLITGTIAQKYIGLYQATQIYFSAPILWLGIILLPGMPVFLGTILINLSFKVFFNSPWTMRNAGIIITHIGMILLLLGGLFTSLFSSEGYIALNKGDTTNIVSDYHIREFVLLDESGKTLETFDHDNIEVGQVISFENTPSFTIKIISSCKNCKISARENKTENHKGMAKHMQLDPAPLKNNDEENMSGTIFQINHKDNHDIFVVIEDVKKYPTINIDGKTYKFALRRQNRNLPFSIELLEFKKETYAGSDMAKSYQSTVLIRDGASQWESIISMNMPLRYKGYTFFQSSFAKTDQGDLSVLAVVWNAGRSFPYIAGITICIGLLLHIFLRLRGFKGKKLAVMLTALLFLNAGQGVEAADLTLDTSYLAQTPILHDGRVKPLDSFAIIQLKKFSGREKGAMAWLTETIFDPARAENRPLFKVSNPELIILLNLDKRKSRLYSYKEISNALRSKQQIILSIIDTDEKDWSSQQSEMITLQENLITMQGLLGSLTMFIPLASQLPENIDGNLKPYAGKTFNYMDSLSFRDDLHKELKSIIADKGYDINSYTPNEQVLAQLSFSLSMLREGGLNSSLFKVIAIDNKNFMSPWEVLNTKTPQSEIFTYWQDLSSAYHNEDISLWNKTAKNLYSASNSVVRRNALSAEYYYNLYNPFYISFILCLLGISVLIISIFWSKNIFNKAALFLLCSSGLFQFIGIAMRMYILERPPVSTIYETIIFVSLITSLYSLMAYLKDKNNLWLWLGIGFGIILNILGFSHSADGDSFVVLSAVLNTNFWLTTHVLCITTAYAFCAFTSVLAHYALIKMVFCNCERDETLLKNLKTASLFALFFASIGTVLGGIWADQSWGRFWGWDPKENGALLIVIWLVWALHGRISGQMRNLMWLCSLSYLSVILSLSWFGVNLLGVGLHSYGFTNSTIWLLSIFIAIETILIIGTALIIKRKWGRFA